MRRRFFYLRLLRLSLMAGAFHDLMLAALLLAIPGLPSPLPEPVAQAPALLLGLLALALAMLGGLCLVAARNPRRYSAVIVAASLGRVLAAAVLGLHAVRHPEQAGAWALAATSLGLGGAHATFWIRQR